jgi:predicted metal-dependent hydrolase
VAVGYRRSIDMFREPEGTDARTSASDVLDHGRSDRAPRPIPIRRPEFDFTRVRSPHWFGGDPFLTHLLNALSLTFPQGERFLMDAVKEYEGRVTSAALRHEITRFLGQEGLHA